MNAIPFNHRVWLSKNQDNLLISDKQIELRTAMTPVRTKVVGRCTL